MQIMKSLKNKTQLKGTIIKALERLPVALVYFDTCFTRGKAQVFSFRFNSTDAISITQYLTHQLRAEVHFSHLSAP